MDKQALVSVRLILGTTQSTAFRELVGHRCHSLTPDTRPDALMGILGSAFLTVTTLGHNCVFNYCSCSVKFISLFTTSSKRDLCLPT